MSARRPASGRAACRVAVLALALSSFGRRSAASQTPPARPSASAPGHRMPYVAPRTHWATDGRATITRQLTALRSAARASVPSSAPSAAPWTPSAPLTGTLRQAVVEVGFSDEPTTLTTGEVDTWLYGPGTAARYSVTHYYDEASFHRFTVTGTTVASITLAKPLSYYVGDRNAGLYPGIAQHLNELLADIVAAADQQADFSTVADSQTAAVPALVVVLAGRSGACAGDVSHVWPHRYRLASLLGQAYTTRSRTAGGQPITLDDYILQSANDCSGNPMGGIGTIVHETGHLLGLPDLYDVTSGASAGPVGDWDVMATGAYNSEALPAQFGAWSRTVLGWSSWVAHSVPAVGTPLALTLGPVQTTGTVHLLPYTQAANEDTQVLLAEYRTATGSDAHVHTEGLAMWYVDVTRVAAGLASNTVNVGPTYGVRLVAADGRDDLALASNRGDASDLFLSLTGAADSLTTSGVVRLPIVGYGVTPGIAVRQMRQIDPATIGFSYAADAAAIGGVYPASLPTLIRGDQVALQFRTDSADLTGYTWQLSPANALQAMGLVLDTAGVLRGTVIGSATTATFTIAAVPTDVLRPAFGRVYTLTVVDVASAPPERLVAALLDPADPLPTAAVQYYDALGNQNGRYDLGDLVVAIRRGRLNLAAVSALRNAALARGLTLP